MILAVAVCRGQAHVMYSVEEKVYINTILTIQLINRNRISSNYNGVMIMIRMGEYIYIYILP